jgi:preprotein translocase subunit SecF
LESLDLQLAPPQPYAYVDSTGRQRYGVQVQTKFLNPEDQEVVIAALETAFGSAGEDTGLEVYGVDPLIGREMLSKSLLALIIAGVLILGYMAFRFEFRSGVAGLFALVFDVMSVIGLFALLQKQVSVTFIAALLTIIGYSINNSIVVFDRVRENLRFRKKGETFAEVVNFSILQTMRRSVNTSATTVITIFLLYLLGSASIREFCLAMMFGFTVGTYTSLFIAGPLWAIWKGSE